MSVARSESDVRPAAHPAAEPVLAAPARDASALDLAITVRGLAKSYRVERVGVHDPHAALLGQLTAPLRRLFGGPRAAPRHPKTFWALDDISFDVERGERVAIIGRNGAGKSTLLKILSRIVTPTRGEARIRGRLTSLLEVGTGFNPALTGRENVYVNAAMHGLSQRETDERFEEIVAFSGIDRRFVDMRVRHYSSGMRVRLAFSVAAHLDPDIMLLDEVLAVGDMAFQEKCLERVEGMMQAHRTIMFVSHNMSAVTRFCRRALWIDHGRIIMDGPVTDVASAYAEKSRSAVAVKKWSDDVPATDDDTATPAPAGSAGDDTAGTARLESVCIVDRDMREIDTATVDQSVGIEFVYDVLAPGHVVLPAARLYDDAGTLVLTAVYTADDWMATPRPPGRYRSVVWLPADFFNVGRLSISVILNGPVSGELVRFAVIEDALALELYEAPYGVPTSAGPYKTVPGVVRPLLDWTTHAID